MSKEGSENSKSDYSKKLLDGARMFGSFAGPQVFSVLFGMIPENGKLWRQKLNVSYTEALKQIIKQKGPLGLFSGVEFVLCKKLLQAGLSGMTLMSLAKQVKPYLSDELLQKYPDAPCMAVAPVSVAVSSFVGLCDGPRINKATNHTPHSLIKYLGKSYNNGGISQVCDTLAKGGWISYGIRIFNVEGFHAFNPVLQSVAKELKGEELSLSEKNTVAGLVGLILSGFTIPAARAFSEIHRHGSNVATFKQAFNHIIKTQGWRGLILGWGVHACHSVGNSMAYNMGLELAHKGGRDKISQIEASRQGRDQGNCR